MSAAPIYKIKDVVYLIESAALGELEAYRVGAIHQQADGVWIYQIFIEQKPPAEQTVGDRIDLKSATGMAYYESDLTDLCGALVSSIANVQSRINRYNNLYVSECTPSAGYEPEAIASGAPRFSIGQQIYVRASAQIGFVETHTVTHIHKVPESAEFMYQLDLTTAKTVDRPITGPTLYFKEREFVNKCEAFDLVLAALDRKMVRLLSLKLAYCTPA